MTSNPTAPTARRAAPELPPTSPVGRISRQRDAEQGFTLIEIVCVLAIIGLIAAILLPQIPRGTSHAQLQAYALEIATLLKRDRDGAVNRRNTVLTDIDAPGRLVQSGFGERSVHIPDDVQFDATLAGRCNQRDVGMTIVFFPSGMSCGGVLAVSRLGVGYQIRVNWFTGGVQVVAVNTQ